MKKTKTATFILNKENPKIEFNMISKDSYLLIKTIFLDSTVVEPQTNWSSFLSTINLEAELYYVVYVDPQGRFIDDRNIQLPINILPDINQIQPVFMLNKLIQNETLTIGYSDEKCYQTLKLELLDCNKLDENYTLCFDVELYDIS